MPSSWDTVAVIVCCWLTLFVAVSGLRTIRASTNVLWAFALSPDSPSPNPNYGGRSSLVVRMDGEERLLEGDDADVIQRFNQLLVRQDPDILLTDWGDSYLLPRLMIMADQLRMPLELNRDPHRSIGTRKPRSYFSYGRILSHAGARILSGRLHLDRHNSFALAETGLAGLIERAGCEWCPVIQEANHSRRNSRVRIGCADHGRKGYLLAED